MKVKFLVKLVKIVYFLLTLLSLLIACIMWGVLVYRREPLMSALLWYILLGLPFCINFALYDIDKFLTRKLGITWGRPLSVTLTRKLGTTWGHRLSILIGATSCLIIVGSAIFVTQWLYAEMKVRKNQLNTPITAPKLEDTETSSTSALPPILSIEDVEFSENPLDANETAIISIHIKNIGRGDAKGLTVHLKSDFQGLSFPSITEVPTIPKKIDQQKVDISVIVDIPVKGTANLSTGKAKIEIYIDEPYFKQRILGKQLTFKTRKLPTPELVLARYAVVEKVSASPNSRIDLNEEIELQFYVQNRGTGIAEKVEIHVENNQTGVIWQLRIRRN